MTDKPKPTYWGRIPADVRYDKLLPPAARLLYAEFDALSKKYGYSWAGNAYFAELYDVKEETISRWINMLLKNDHISVRIVQKEHRRYIYLLTKKSIAPLTEISSAEGGAIDENVKGPIDEIVNHNKTSINNTRESEKDPPSRSFKKGPKGEKCLEEICWDNYLLARAKFKTALDPEFYDFFEQEVLGRYPRQEVYYATLSDWYNEIWGEYEVDDIIAVLKRLRGASNAWQIRWDKVESGLKATEKAKIEQKDVESYHRGCEQREKEHLEKMQVRKEERLEMAMTKPEKFMQKYRHNPLFKKIVDEEPELAKYVTLPDKTRGRQCKISSDGKVTCTEKRGKG